MKTNLLLLILGLAGLLAFHAAAGQEQLAGSIRDARVETARTADQLKSTLATLTALTKQTQGDLRPAYDAFAHEVANTEAAAAWTGTRVKWMATDGRQYFADWQRNLD
ncbi:MAG TPA: DUF2959 family protein, partial [Verrucomicrobiota bacterium]|nr:DUF2959 family protein [Verrucomicrobiota bacterium]